MSLDSWTKQLGHVHPHGTSMVISESNPGRLMVMVIVMITTMTTTTMIRAIKCSVLGASAMHSMATRVPSSSS